MTPNAAKVVAMLNEVSVVKAIPISAERLAVLGVSGASSRVLLVERDGRSEVARFAWRAVDITQRGSGELLVLGRDGQLGSVVDGNVNDSWL